MIPLGKTLYLLSGGIPRESGDDPLSVAYAGDLPWYSPRERG